MRMLLSGDRRCRSIPTRMPVTATARLGPCTVETVDFEEGGVSSNKIACLASMAAALAVLTACNPQNIQYEQLSGGTCRPGASPYYTGFHFVYDGPIGTRVWVRTEPSDTWEPVGWTTEEHVVWLFASNFDDGKHCPEDGVLTPVVKWFKAEDAAGRPVGNFESDYVAKNCEYYCPDIAHGISTTAP